MWWRAPLGDDWTLAVRRSRWVMGIGLLVLLLLVTDLRPWLLFQRGPYTSDFYDAQADSLLHGRLSVPRDVMAIEGFEIGDEVHMYFGIMLALVRLPFAWIPGIDGRLAALSILLGYAAAGSATFAIARRAHARLAPEVAVSWRVPLLVACVAASPLVFCASTPLVYHETEMWGAATVLVAVASVLAARDDHRSVRIVLAGAAASAALLTRISTGLGAMCAIALLVLWLLRTGRRRDAVRLGALAAAGCAVQASVNHLRFGSFTSIPWDRQTLTLLDPGRAAWLATTDNTFTKPEFVVTNLVQYLRPDAVRLERLAPFVRFGPRADVLGDSPFETVDRAASITSTAPLLTVLAVVGLVVVLRRRDWWWTGLVVAAGVATSGTLVIGFIAQRYLTDFVPVVVVAACAGVWTVRPVRRVSALALVGALAWAAWCNVGLAVWSAHFRELGFTRVRYALDDALFGSLDAPSAVASPDVAVRDGLILTLPGCTGLYIGDGDTWRTVALPTGTARRLVEVDLTGAVSGEEAGNAGIAVVGTDTTTVVVAPDGDGTRADVHTPDGTTRGRPVATSGAVTVEVVADPITGESVVRLDGQDSIVAAGLLSGPLQVFDGVTEVVDDRGLEVCRSIIARLP